MKLYDEVKVEVKPKGKTKTQKIIILSLVISILLLFLAIGGIVFMKFFTTKAEVLVANSVNHEINGMIIDSETGGKYISLRRLAKVLGYEFYNGEFNKITEDKNKCYIDNNNEIIGFEIGKDKFYKTIQTSIMEPVNYELENEIIADKEGDMYISIQDLERTFNIKYSFLENENKHVINTANVILEDYKVAVQTSGDYSGVLSNYNNEQILKYNMLIVEKEGKFGVVSDTSVNNIKNKKEEIIIGTKYKSLYFDEYTQKFIVSLDTNQFGVVDQSGEAIIKPLYDEVQIINYNPVLYKVKKDGKFGVLNEQGYELIKLDYEAFGFEGDFKNDFNPLLLVPNINGETGIVTIKNGKYGILNLASGAKLLDFVGDLIYFDKADPENNYVIKVENDRFNLYKYIESQNTEQVIIL